MGGLVIFRSATIIVVVFAIIGRAAGRGVSGSKAWFEQHCGVYVLSSPRATTLWKERGQAEAVSVLHFAEALRAQLFPVSRRFVRIGVLRTHHKA